MRRLLPLGVAALAVLAACCYWLGTPQLAPDFAIWWTAGRALLHGTDPYAAVVAMGRGYPFFYPLTAALVTAPFALLPVLPAHLLFAACSGAAFAVAAPRLGPGVLIGCLSACFLGGAASGHWAPLLLAGAGLPWLAGLWAVKPSIGLALFAGFPSRRAVLGAAGLLAVSLALRPGWPAQWLAAAQSGPYRPLAFRPGGALLLLAFASWRDPRCRVLATLALVPQIGVLYDALPVFLAARSRWEGYGLAALSWAVAFAQFHALHGARFPAGAEADVGWPWLLVGLYLPALALVLRPRPRPDPA